MEIMSFDVFDNFAASVIKERNITLQFMFQFGPLALSAI